MTVGPNGSVTADLALTPLNGTVTGTITNAQTGAAIDNASVTLETGQSATTDATGAYTIANVTPGTYNLTADHANYSPNITSVTVGPNGSVTADLGADATERVDQRDGNRPGRRRLVRSDGHDRQYGPDGDDGRRRNVHDPGRRAWHVQPDGIAGELQ
ncbi:MAG: carboxypeptidase-like regulatory domain-containing protein [Natrialbaceae archaeon]|nr:carboxypeptidase-like regulatory domain-containing protein [Natrialbaceae archaeon]